MKTIKHPLAWYHYNTPKVSINWNTHKQQGLYYSALAALNKIYELNQFPNKSDVWEICTPNENINVTNLINK